MRNDELLRFMRSHKLAVLASVTPSGAPEAAVVGIAVTQHFEIVFDTSDSSRKVANLRRKPKAAFVIGGLVGGDERTVQYEGVADEPAGLELQRVRRAYFTAHPTGRLRLAWPGLIHVRVRPRCVRYSDFNADPPQAAEFSWDGARMSRQPAAGP